MCFNWELKRVLGTESPLLAHWRHNSRLGVELGDEHAPYTGAGIVLAI